MHDEQDLWKQVSEEYHCDLPFTGLFRLLQLYKYNNMGQWPIAVRRKDIAEKIAAILIDSGLSIAEAISLLNQMVGHLSDPAHSASWSLCNNLYPKRG